MKIIRSLCALVLLCTASAAYSEEDPLVLRAEGMDALRLSETDPNAVVTAARKFTAAEAIFELQKDDRHCVEMNSFLYWCRKKMSAKNIDEFLRDPYGARVVNKLSEITKPVPASNAQAYYDRAEKFASDNPTEHLAIAIRFFEVADRFAGSNLSLEAQRKSLTAQQAAMKDLNKNNSEGVTHAAPKTRNSDREAMAAINLHAIPDANAQSQAEKIVKEVYKDDYLKTKSADKIALAQKLLKQGDETKDDPASQYVLWSEARRLSEQAAELDLALSAIEKLRLHFKVDALALEHNAMTAVAASTTDPELSKVVSAMLVLLDKPNNRDANLVVGSYKCFVKDEWVAGLPMLDASGDMTLKDLADKELTASTDPKAIGILGDAWFDAAEKVNGKTKQAMQKRAMHWYEKAAPGLTGLSKAKAEKRIETLKSSKVLAGAASLDPCVDLAMHWLADHQESDGHWDAKKNGSVEKTDTACTGFALWALTAAGNSEKDGNYQATVRKAVAWLKSKQASNGLIWDTTDAGGFRGTGYPHGIAGTALCRAAGLSKIADTVQCAQRAVNYSTNIHQDPVGGGFRYAPKNPGCLSVSGWYFQQLATAKSYGVFVDAEAVSKCRKFLESVEYKNGTTVLFQYMPKERGAPHRLAMVGAADSILLGLKPKDLQPSIEFAIKEHGLPTYGTNGALVDLYYWHYGTLATSLVGGDISKEWNEALKAALIPHQKKTVDIGSWDPVGQFATEWGRVGQTALACIALINASK